MRSLIVAVVALSMTTCAFAAEPMSAGVAVVDITPPIGYRMSGYFYERPSTGVHDPLHAKAIVLKQGDQRIAMVFCDLIGLSLDVTTKARKAAEAQTGIPAGNILIAATHSHTGPLYCDALREYLHTAAVEKEGKDPREAVDYPADLTRKITQAIVDANAALRPVRMESVLTEQVGLSFNRRYHMKDGTVRFNPGIQNPDTIRPAGPTDPRLGVVLFRETQGNAAMAGLVNFALHLDTTGGTLYSADYPYYLEQSLQAEFGQKFTLLFGTGTCGDINHIDVSTKDRRSAPEIGAKLGETVKAALKDLKPVDPALALRRTIVEVPLQKYAADKIAWSKESMPEVGGKKLTFLEQVEAYKIQSLQLRGGRNIALEVQAIRLGPDLAIVGLPGEIFVELGLAIKKASPFKTTLIIELCQDTPEYIPTRKAFAEGSYEIVNSRVAPGGGETLAETAIGLLKQLAPRE